MEPGSILVTLAIALLAASYIARPLVTRRSVAVSDAERRLSALQAERDQVLDMLRDVDMDFTMGKISPDDYQAQRADLMVRGASILRAIDESEGAAKAHPFARGEGTDQETEQLEAELEAAVKRLRSREPQAVEEDGYCGRCGEAVKAGDRFCFHCGAPLGVQEAAG